MLESKVYHAVGMPPRPPAGGRGPRESHEGPLAPAETSAAAEASERARPTTSWPEPMSSGTTAEPIQPDAPVTKTRMRTSKWSYVITLMKRVRCQSLS